jgi:hypothetical protein
MHDSFHGRVLGPGEFDPDDKFLPDRFKPPERLVDYFAGLDLGQLADPSAAAVVERTVYPRSGARPTYSVRHLQRWPLGTPYPQIVEAVRALLARPNPATGAPLLGSARPNPATGAPLLGSARLVVDATGVGRAVVDLFRLLPELTGRLTAVSITGGKGSRWDDKSAAWNVAKVELVGDLQAELGHGRLKVAKSLPHAETLIQELTTFSVKITAAGNETFEAWRERDHDDLVLALAVALWYAARAPVQQGAGPGPVVLTPGAGGAGGDGRGGRPGGY